jgi:hypothetical protein
MPLLIAIAIALAIASLTGRAGAPSPGRFILRFIIALIIVILVGALLVFGAFELIFGRSFPGG